MNFEVKTTPDFERSLKRISKKYRSIRADVSALIEKLEKEPYAGVRLNKLIQNQTKHFQYK